MVVLPHTAGGTIWGIAAISCKERGANKEPWLVSGPVLGTRDTVRGLRGRKGDGA